MPNVLILWISLSFFVTTQIKCDVHFSETNSTSTFVSPNINLTSAVQTTEQSNQERQQNTSSMFLLELDNPMSEVYNYTGRLNYNESCMSDATKEDILQNPNDKTRPSREVLEEKLQNESCNITKFLECRQIGVMEQQTKNGSIGKKVQPILTCRCPDYDKIETIHPRAYFDFDLDQCVLKARTKCSGFIIPTSARRYNGTTLNRVRIDNRTQPTSLPCVKNGICNMNESTDDTTSNDCICQEGYFPGDDNECKKIGRYDTSSGTLSALILVIIAFALFFTVMLCDCDQIWSDNWHGRQEELISPEHFRKKIFLHIKRDM